MSYPPEAQRFRAPSGLPYEAPFKFPPYSRFFAFDDVNIIAGNTAFVFIRNPLTSGMAVLIERLTAFSEATRRIGLIASAAGSGGDVALAIITRNPQGQSPKTTVHRTMSGGNVFDSPLRIEANVLEPIPLDLIVNAGKGWTFQIGEFGDAVGGECSYMVEWTEVPTG